MRVDFSLGNLQIQRAAEHGIEKIIGVSGSLTDSEGSISVAKKFPNIFATVGVHPTRCGEFDESGDAGSLTHMCLSSAGTDIIVPLQTHI